MTPALKSFPATLNALPDVLACVNSFRDRVDNDTLWRLLIVVEELFVNVVEHGRASHFTPQVWLGIASANGRLELRFEDSAAAFDPFCSLEQALAGLDVSLAQRKEGGLGRLLIQQLADSASYSREQGRNRIDMSFLLAKDGQLKPTFSGPSHQ